MPVGDGGGGARRRIGAALAALAGVVAALALGEALLRLLGFGDPVLYDNRAVYGYRPLPDQTRRRLGGTRVHVNALGLRGPDVEPARPPGTVRLLFLGDSVTWGGSYVDDADIFPTVAGRTLAARLPPGKTEVEALDAGVNAWGPQNILGLVGGEGAYPDGFQSDVWVVTALEDDFRREKTHVGEVPYFNRAPATAWEELLVLAAYRVLTGYKEEKPSADLARVADDNLAAYRTLVTHARDVGARVLLVWHPSRPALAGTPEPHKAPFLALEGEVGTGALDLTPAYTAAGGPALYEDGLHLNSRGHTVAGRVIGDWLAEALSLAR